MGIPHDQLIEVLDDVIVDLGARGDQRIEQMFPGTDMRVITFTSATGFSLLRMVPDRTNDRTHIQVAGGAARGVANQDGVFRVLVERYSDFDWGGPFARAMGDRTLALGCRLNVPSDLLNISDLGAGFGYLIAMVNLLGEIGRGLGEEIVSTYGGRVFDGRDDDDTHWYAALLGQLPPGFEGAG